MESKSFPKTIDSICLDIDDTLSTDGKLTPQAYDALWRLKNSGFRVVPVTGRPAGWCDHIARFWPVDAVVGENGAFTFYMKDKSLERLNTSFEFEPEVAQKKLKVLHQKILQKFPHAKTASDQFCRQYDLAIDFCEDVLPWGQVDLDALVQLCLSEGAHAKVSSIHVNIWYGNYVKWTGFENYLNAVIKEPFMKERWVYVGDSPNDEPMFEKFEWSAGVANIEPFLKTLTYKPRIVLAGKSGEGFCELVDQLIKNKN